jgi:hypothetical protein
MWRQTHIAASALSFLLGACGCGARIAAPGLGSQAAPLSVALLSIAPPPVAPPRPAGTGGPDDGASPDLILRGVAFARLVGGRVVASGAADELRFHRSGGRFETTQGRARIFPGPGAEALRSLGEVRVTAPRMRGELSGRTATASGGVDAVAARGDTARTDRVTLDGKARTLSGDRPVDARGPGYTLRGHDFLARTDGSRVQLGGGAGGTLLPDPAPAKIQKIPGGRP